MRVSLGLDGSGTCQVATSVPFLDPMLHQISRHGLIDLEIQATGDTHNDDHHTNEDVGIALAQEELGDGIPGMGAKRLRVRASAGNSKTDSRLPPTSAASTWGAIRPACTSR